MKLSEWLNDYTVTGYRIAISEKIYRIVIYKKRELSNLKPEFIKDISFAVKSIGWV